MGALLESIKNLDGAAILAVVVSFNASLVAIGAFLDKVKDRTATDLDNKLSLYLHKAVTFLGKVIDFATGNKEHK